MLVIHCRQVIARYHREGRVGQLMRENGKIVEITHKFKATKDSDHTFNIAPNLLDRDFYAPEPNQKCLSVNASIHLSVTGR